MTLHLNILKNNNIKKKVKILKKFRYWRLFKKLFLVLKKKNFFIRFSSYYNYRRSLINQFKIIFGVNLKKIAFSSTSKYGFNSHFFDYWSSLESTLFIVLVRVKFFSKIIESFLSIKKKLISVNGNIILFYKYFIKPGFLIQKCRLKIDNLNFRFNKYMWRSNR